MWQELESALNEFEKLELQKVIDFEAFSRIAITHHSTSIEGNTLTLEETTLLLTQGITSRGKPLSEHNMVKDHYEALAFCLENAAAKVVLTPVFLKQLNALVNKNTEQVRNTALGVCDDTKGDFRPGNVSAGATYFVNFNKVVSMAEELCEKLQAKIYTATTNREIYQLSFDAHYYLVSILPWFDGNGRASRLLMNFIQAYHGKPLSMVFIEDKAAYIKSLNDTRAVDDLDIFRNFLCGQHIKYLRQEIGKFQKKDNGISFLF